MVFKNKKLLISIILAFTVFVAGIVGFVVVPNALNQFHAATLDKDLVKETVSGNGGAAVAVGEYLYFTSGYVSKEEYKYKQNTYNKVRGEGDGGIFRVKMTGGLPTYNNDYLHYLKNFVQGKENDRFDPANAAYADIMNKVLNKDTLELIVPKIAGFEDTAIWIYGNTLIYTSPNEQKDKYGQLQRNKLDFYKCNLKGKNHKKIYSTKTDSIKQSDYTVAWDGAPYLVIKDGEKLNRISMSGKIKTVSKKVISAVFPKVTSYFSGKTTVNGQSTLTDDRWSLENSFSGVMSYVFYTEKHDDDDTEWRGDILCRAKVSKWKGETLREGHETHYLYALGNGALMFQVNYESPSPAELYVVYDVAAKDQDDLATFSTSALKSRYRMSKTIESEEQVYLCGEKTLQSEFKYITLANGALYVYTLNQGNIYNPQQIANEEEVDTVIAVNSGNIMYKSKTGDLVIIDWKGGNRIYASGVNLSNAIGRTTAFAVLDKYGQANGNYMFFTVVNITAPSTETTTDENGNEMPVASTTKPTMAGQIFLPSIDGGKDFLLARLDVKKYVNLPKQEE